MEITTMNYNEDDYQKYYHHAVDMLGNIRIKRLKYEHDFVIYKGERAIKADKVDNSLLSAFLFPEQVYEKINNVIDSINITQQFLTASYSLLKLQLDEINLNKLDDKSPLYFWFVFYFEDTASRISTLNDLLWNLVNYFYNYNMLEKLGMIKDVKSKLERDGRGILVSLLSDTKYATRTIRNHSVHNTKPFLYRGSTTIKDGVIAIGQGKRYFELENDMYKIEDDIKILSEKYEKVISELKLETL